VRSPRNNITITFQPRELAQVRRRAYAEGKTVSAFLRALALGDKPLDLSPAQGLVLLAAQRFATGKLTEGELAGLRGVLQSLLALRQAIGAGLAIDELIAPAAALAEPARRSP
jgi:hypothetical protein